VWLAAASDEHEGDMEDFGQRQPNTPTKYKLKKLDY
jgi:hypothetical protein